MLQRARRTLELGRPVASQLALQLRLQLGAGHHVSALAHTLERRLDLLGGGGLRVMSGCEGVERLLFHQSLHISPANKTSKS